MMETVYITKSKLELILNKVDLSEVSKAIDDFQDGKLRAILSVPELKYLNAYKFLLQHGDEIPKYIGNKLTNQNRSPKTRIIYLKSTNAYHLDPDCRGLMSDYENYYIPPEIKEEDIESYRNFFIDNIHQFKTRRDVFFANVELKFSVVIQNVEKIERPNSGLEATTNFVSDSQEAIEESINKQIESMLKYKTSDDRVNQLISAKGYGSDRASFYNEHGEWTRYIDDSENNPIKIWHAMKMELKQLIKRYFIALYNPELEFNGLILESLGFKACAFCNKRKNEIR